MRQESELVAGFFTEHSSLPFVIFFLAEYASIALMSVLTVILFLGGYLITEFFYNPTFISIEALILGLKTSIIIFIFIWVRASFPRLRFDQLLNLTWIQILPLVLAFTVLIPSIIIGFEIII